MSSSLLPELDESPAGMFAILPVEVVQYIVSFLGLYESIGLGETSKWFHDLVWPIFKARFHYEPWGYDPTYDTPILKAVRQGLGEYLIGPTPDEDADRLRELAVRAYREMNHRVFNTLQKQPAAGVGLEILAKLAKNTTTTAVTPHGKIEKSLYGANCLAVLTLDDKMIWALNFQVPWIGNLPERLAAVCRKPLQPIEYTVQKRHAEMRLIMKIAHRHQRGALDIDKVCCIFCASQLIALGYRNVIVGWNRGNLNWYTFSPLVLYFQDHRRTLWGDLIDAEFMELTLPQKLAFLRMLVAQTRAVQPKLAKRARDPVLERAPKRAETEPDPASNLPGPCPMCGRYECWEDYNDGKGWQLNCPLLADI